MKTGIEPIITDDEVTRLRGLFAARLDAMIQARELSKVDFAARAGVSRAQIYNICGSTRSPSLDFIEKASLALTCHPHEFLDLAVGVDSMTPLGSDAFELDTTPLRDRVAANLAPLVKAYDGSQRVLSARAGLSYSGLHYILTAKNSCRLDSLIRLAFVLDIPLEDLVR